MELIEVCLLTISFYIHQNHQKEKCGFGLASWLVLVTRFPCWCGNWGAGGTVTKIKLVYVQFDEFKIFNSSNKFVNEIETKFVSYE